MYFHSMSDLLEKLRDRSATIGIIGLGYVGLPLGETIAQSGFAVIGFDIDAAKIEALCSGRSYIHHLPPERLADLLRADPAAIAPRTIHPTADFSLLGRCDAILICVPTPLTANRDPDLSYVVSTTETIARHLRPGQLVVLESTTYPGTTDEVMRPILEETGLRAGRDFFLAFSPEREDPNNPNFTTRSIPKVVGGVTPRCGEVAVALYQAVIEKVVPVSSARVAEATKLLENIYRSVNIALVNELKVLFDRMGLNVWEVIDAAATKPFGFTPFYPGPGLGGHCIPIDPFYLTWKARQYDLATRFIELAGEVNRSMPAFVVDKLAEALNDRRQSLRGAKVLVLGVAYKRDLDDTRESPSLRLIQLLLQKGVEVHYNDPYVPVLKRSRHYDFGLKSTPLTRESLGGMDAVIISTDHTSYDYGFVVESSRLVIDTRNATRQVQRDRGRIVFA